MATEAQLLNKNAFNQLVLEEGLKTWEANGYIYAGKRGTNGWELYRTYGPKWRMLYQARRVNTQAAGGGGALVTRIQVASGMAAQLVAIHAVGSASAGSALAMQLWDEDGNICGYLGGVPAGVSRTCTAPNVGSAGTGSNNLIASIGLIIGPGMYIYTQSSAAIQTETHTVYAAFLLPIDATTDSIIWDTTGSAGTPGLGASTISPANTLQPVLLP